MTQVDPFDDSKVRYVIRKHKFDPGTKHFRWIIETAFDDKKEFEAAIDQAFQELELRRQSGEAHVKEQVSGMKLDIGHFKNSQRRRLLRQEQGAFLPDNLITRIRTTLPILKRRFR